MVPDAFEARIKNLATSIEADLESGLSEERSAPRLVEVVRRMDLFADEEIEYVQGEISKAAQRGNGKNLDCKAGCSWCCHGVVLATIPEVLGINAYVRENFSSQETQELDARVDKYVESIASQGDLMKSRAACPFLANDLCTIYEARPLSCRGLNSVNVETCIEIYQNRPRPRASVPAQNAVAEAVTFGHRSGLFFEALDNRFVDLGRATHALRTLPTPIDSYLSGQDVVGNCKLILPQDRFLAPDIQRNLEPAFKSRSEKSQPAGEPTKSDLARVSAFQKLFYASGEFSKAMQAIGGTSPVELIAKLQVPYAYASEDEIHFWRQHAIAALREFAEADIDAQNAFNVLSMLVPLSMAYQGLDDKDFMREQSEIFSEKIFAKVFPDLVESIELKPPKGRKLRVGYLSQHIRYHSGARWTLGWIRNHGEDIESFVFNVGYGEDRFSRIFQQQADHYFFLARSVPENARFIKSLDLDVLIMPDAQASARNLQYSLFRLAPVQCCAWGHPVTTGAPTMDYYLSSQMMEPDNAQDQYTEKLVLLPNSGLCYPHFTQEPVSNAGRSHFGIAEDKPFLYLAQATLKCLPQYDYLYKEISDRLDAPIVVHEHRADIAKIAKRRFQKAGIKTHWLPHVGRPEFLRLMQLCDVSLDTPMWSGGNTTIEALTFGKPVVTLPGPYMRSRHSYAFLKIAGAEGLIASDAVDYIALATDLDRQQAALTNLNSEALYEDKTCVQALDNFLRTVTAAL